MYDTKSLIIPLRKSTNATLLKEEKYLLQQKALKNITEIINNNLNKIVHHDVSESDRNHETITLLGERGTGKTSFLINFKNFYKRKDEVVFLDTIDPTLFEDRQNIMITIISMIHKEVESKELHENEDWLDKLAELAEGLNLLDGVGSDPLKKDIWDDSRIILEVGLRNANSGLKLEKNFNIFIKKSLDLLDKKMFIITFDDIDTDIKKGWPVLEVIRKYMTSPFIQIIISGDWNLYSKIVRLHQWKQIKETPELSVENDKITIDQLEEQYLTKILKPENRIVLKDLKSIISDEYKIIINDSKTEINDHELETIYKNIFSEILSIRSNKTINTFIYLLLSLPVRTNIQILIAYFDYIHEENIFKEIKNSNQNKKNFLEKLSNIFITKIARFNFSDKDFDSLMGEETLSFLIKKFYKLNENNDHDFVDLFNFNPIYDFEDMNIFIMVLNAYVVNIINKKPYKIFEWLFRIQYFNKFILEGFDYKIIYNYLSCNIKTKITEQTTKIIGLSHLSIPTTGFYKLYKYDRWNRDSNLKGLDKFILDIKNDKNFSNEVKLTFDFLLNISLREVKDKNESETKAYVSLLNIVSFISESLNNFSNINDLVKKQNIFCYSKNNIDSTIYYENDDENYADLSIIKEYEEWLNLSAKLKPISIELINSIWNEYYISLQTLPLIDNYKDLLEHQLIRLFNTIVKEMERKNNNSPESFPLIKTDLKRFERSIKKSSYETFFNSIKTNSNINNFDEFDFFEFLLICPLWKYYVDFPISRYIENNVLDLGDNKTQSYSDLFKKLALSKDKNETILVDDIEKIVESNNSNSEEKIGLDKDSILETNDLEDNIMDEELIVKDLIIKNIDKIDEKNVEKYIWDMMRKNYKQYYKGQRTRKDRNELIKKTYDELKESLN